MEKLVVKNVNNSPALHFAIAAMVSHQKTHGENSIPDSSEKGTLDVELRINGVEVPFVESIEDIYSRFEKAVDRRAAEKAMQTLEGFPDAISAIIETCKYDLKHFIAQKLGKTTEELFPE